MSFYEDYTAQHPNVNEKKAVNIEWVLKLIDEARHTHNVGEINTDGNTIIGKNTDNNGEAIALTIDQVRTMLNVANGANNYSHPTHTARNTVLTGINVYSNIIVDSQGHITGLSTRALNQVTSATSARIKSISDSQIIPVGDTDNATNLATYDNVLETLANHQLRGGFTRATGISSFTGILSETAPYDCNISANTSGVLVVCQGVFNPSGSIGEEVEWGFVPNVVHLTSWDPSNSTGAGTGATLTWGFNFEPVNSSLFNPRINLRISLSSPNPYWLQSGKRWIDRLGYSGTLRARVKGAAMWQVNKTIQVFTRIHS
jgi:hypothetical protein